MIANEHLKSMAVALYPRLVGQRAADAMSDVSRADPKLDICKDALDSSRSYDGEVRHGQKWLQGRAQTSNLVVSE